MNIKKLCFILILCIFIITISTSCSFLCSNTIVTEIPGPKQNNKVVIFERNCGATTGFSTQVSILPYDDLLPYQGGNTFIVDTDHGEAPAAEWGGPEVKVKWISSSKIELLYHKNARVFKSEKDVRGITIHIVSLNSFKKIKCKLTGI